MELPTEAELDEVAALIAGFETPFKRLSPDKKITVIDLALKAKSATILDDIDTRLSAVESWFTKSRLFEGLPYK